MNNKSIALVTSVPETLFYFYAPILNRLKTEGYSITLITSEGSWVNRSEIEEKHGIPVHLLDFKRVFSPLNDIKQVWKMYRLLRVVKPDVLHASTPKAAFVSLVAGFFAGINLRIYSVRGLIAYGKPFPVKQILHLAEKIACALSHIVIVNSESNRKYLAGNLTCKYHKIHILGNGSGQGVDSVRFSPESVLPERVAKLRNQLDLSASVFVFGFVGRLVRDKGVEDLAAVWKDFSLKYPLAKLMIVGPKHEPRDRISDKCARILETTPSIIYAGQQKDCRDYYALMNALVLPSYREGFPNVVLEAYAMAKPVITTDAPGCVDSVRDGETGLLIGAGNRNELMAAMEKLILNGQLCRDMGVAGRKWVKESFQPEKIVDDLYNLYRQLPNYRNNQKQ
jgi:glycosyltransferase involved in cell wall biosynthesis